MQNPRLFPGLSIRLTMPIKRPGAASSLIDQCHSVPCRMAGSAMSRLKCRCSISRVGPRNVAVQEPHDFPLRKKCPHRSASESSSGRRTSRDVVIVGIPGVIGCSRLPRLFGSHPASKIDILGTSARTNAEGGVMLVIAGSFNAPARSEPLVTRQSPA
jgi:hypothetical protein